VDINFSPRSLLFLDYCFPFFARGKFVRTFNFSEGGFLSPPPPEELCVTFLLG
jgi:hypothetical protein